MGWNAAGLLVEGEIGSDVLAALPGAPLASGETGSGDEVFSSSFAADYAVATVGGWTVLADPWISALYDETLTPRLAEGRRVLTFILNGATDTYGIGWYVDGAVVRDVLVVEGETVAEEGVPLPEEDGIGFGAEDDVFALTARLTAVDFGTIAEAEYRYLSNSAPE
ncbi:hypothetical protein [Nocardia sp. bgisy134]|uniref:hypothetical protein n=1 Tax=unclassified Nocardia TaxID=2637762 RepID=UPI003D758EC9